MEHFALLGNIVKPIIIFLLLWEDHLIQILSAVIREHFVLNSVKIIKNLQNSVQKNENYAILSL